MTKQNSITAQSPSHKCKCFLAEESGAVTVDWIFLTAICVALAIVVMTSIGAGTVGAAASIESSLEESAGILCEGGVCD
ncbi:hypothetical protein [Boseongicola aestuarii]|uniref:Uncharacterized protein n=1 Tax=Boseongicola aestuarii TaxID=1470561 RepID=A0A238J263_9RHOB|nr:hypothetical protein [Boseongicola aestuarii]SMX24697.1 hypothetical protein BOA8489_02824 [Boseongicola aestuarii]